MPVLSSKIRNIWHMVCNPPEQELWIALNTLEVLTIDRITPIVKNYRESDKRGVRLISLSILGANTSIEESEISWLRKFLEGNDDDALLAARGISSIDPDRSISVFEDLINNTGEPEIEYMSASYYLDTRKSIALSQWGCNEKSVFDPTRDKVTVWAAAMRYIHNSSAIDEFTRYCKDKKENSGIRKYAFIGLCNTRAKTATDIAKLYLNSSSRTLMTESIKQMGEFETTEMLEELFVMLDNVVLEGKRLPRNHQSEIYGNILLKYAIIGSILRISERFSLFDISVGRDEENDNRAN